MTASTYPSSPTVSSIELDGLSFSHDEGLGAGRTSVNGMSMPVPGKALDVYHGVKVGSDNRLQATLVAEYRAADAKSQDFMRAAFPEDAGYKHQVTLNKLGKEGSTIRVSFPPIDLNVGADKLNSPSLAKFASSLGMDSEEAADARPVDLFARRAIHGEPVRRLLMSAVKRAASHQALAELEKTLPSHALEGVRSELAKQVTAKQEIEGLSLSLHKRSRPDIYQAKRIISDEHRREFAGDAKAFALNVSKLRPTKQGAMRA